MKKRTGMILYDKQKRILLQQRTDDAPISPGKWGAFGGGKEGNETPKATTKREFWEEVNYKLEGPRLLFRYSLKNGDEVYIFAEKYDGLQKLKLNEGKDMKWFSLDEAKKLDLAKNFIKAVNKLEKRLLI